MVFVVEKVFDSILLMLANLLLFPGIMLLLGVQRTLEILVNKKRWYASVLMLFGERLISFKSRSLALKRMFIYLIFVLNSQLLKSSINQSVSPPVRYVIRCCVDA